MQGDEEKKLIMEAAVNCFISLFIHAGVHHKESFVQFKAAGDYYTMNAGHSLGCSLHILLLPCVEQILHPHPCPPTPVLQHITDRVDAGVDQHCPGLGPG